MIEIEILEDRIKFIDKRLAELQTLIARQPTGGYQRQELETERAELAAHRRVADNKLRELTGRDDPAERQRKAENAARIAAIRASRTEAIRRNCLDQAQEFEKQGDHRNARVWRLAALDARTQAERET